MPGQVRGGRWKPLQYFYRRSIYADVMASCGDGGSCYIKNDAIVPFDGRVDVTSLELATGKTALVKSISFAGADALAAGALIECRLETGLASSKGHAQRASLRASRSFQAPAPRSSST